MKRARISVVAAVVGLALSGAASAYNIYNNTKDPLGGSIEVWGEFCMRCFHGHVKQGDHKSCPHDEKGCGGHTQISACVLSVGGAQGNVNQLRNCAVKVPARGWVEFVDRVPPWDASNDSYFGCFVYDENGKKLNDGWMPPADPGDAYGRCGR